MAKRMMAAALVLCVACGSPAPPQTAQPPAGTIDQLLAPVALYPDQLLAQILISATEPDKVTELDKWMAGNQKLKGTQLQDAAVKAGFDASFVALVLFPKVVAYMADQIVWTRLLGHAFTTDRSAVFASIQKLRLLAKDVGTLKSTPQQAVETKRTTAGEEVIVIEPTNPQVVYVPQYNPQVVYTQAPTTVIIQEDDDDAELAVAAGLIGFTAGIAIGAAMNNSYYYGPYGWRGGGYMYNDAWDDYYDHREDAREDWMDHREDLVEERSDRFEDRSETRSDRLENTQEQRTDRQQNRQENRPESQAQRSERRTQAQSASTQRASTERTSTERATAATQQTQRTQQTPQTQQTQRSRTGSTEARGYESGESRAASQRSSSDAFSGYSSGSSQRTSSERGQRSRGSSASRRGGGGGGRRR